MIKITESNTVKQKEKTNKMSKVELVERLADSLTKTLGGKVTKKAARSVFDEVINLISSEITSQEGYEVKNGRQRKTLSISGFGHFTVSSRNYSVLPGKPGEKTGGKPSIVTRKTVSFRPAKSLKTLLRDEVETPVAPAKPAV